MFVIISWDGRRINRSAKFMVLFSSNHKPWKPPTINQHHHILLAFSSVLNMVFQQWTNNKTEMLVFISHWSSLFGSPLPALVVQTADLFTRAEVGILRPRGKNSWRCSRRLIWEEIPKIWGFPKMIVIYGYYVIIIWLMMVNDGNKWGIP